MEFKLEVVVVPVADVDLAKEFYVGRLGFVVDVDAAMPDGTRILQTTPPGSACSVTFGPMIVEPGSAAPRVQLQLVVRDVKAAHECLVERGVECSPVTQLAPGDGGSFVFFEDPFGNGWAVQEFAPSFA